MPESRTVIFIHNPKTGGRTLRRITDRQYEPNDIIVVPGEHYQPSTVEQYLAVPDNDHPSLIRGHIPFGVHGLIPFEFTYITLLREPVDRVLSQYSSMLERRRRWMFRNGEPITLEEYVSSGCTKEVDNVQTRRLSGVDPPFRQCSEDMLDRAKQNIRDHFAVVGLTERFDHTLMLLRRILGWRYILYFRMNVTKARVTRASVPKELQDLIASYNQLDIELYRYATDSFEALVRQQGPDFEAEVQTFKRVNDEYARFEVFTGGREARSLDAPDRSPPRVEWPTLEAELRASAFEEHPRLLAGQLRLRNELRQLKNELRRTQTREARVSEELERVRAPR